MATKVFVAVCVIVFIPHWLYFVRYMVRETRRYRQTYPRKGS